METPFNLSTLLIIFVGLLIIIAKGLYVLREYERAVIFRFGRLASGIVGKNGPGIIIILPLIDFKTMALCCNNNFNSYYYNY